MTTSMYFLYVGIDYTYIDINALAQGFKSFFGFTPLLGLEPVVTDTSLCMYVCIMYVCMHACKYTSNTCVCVCVCVCV